ncbi:MAG: hypothetical protein ACYCOU_16255 [Sulfobacillus sp.]
MKSNSNTDKVRAARMIAGAKRGTPVAFVSGDGAPTLVGRDGYYVARHNHSIIVRYPVAYQVAGGRTDYICATRRVIVGEDWAPPEMDRDEKGYVLRRGGRRYGGLSFRAIYISSRRGPWGKAFLVNGKKIVWGGSVKAAYATIMSAATPASEMWG